MTRLAEYCQGARSNKWVPKGLVLGAVLLTYLVLGVVYSISLPVLEAPDEMWHYSYVRHLTVERRLPPWNTESPAGQESSQPPLYYATAALATGWIDASPPGELLDRNPYWGYPAAGTVNDNKNMFFHRGTGSEGFPWQGAAHVVHVARLVNLAFGALTVGVTYLLAREIFLERLGAVVAATAVVAFNPQFLFISSAVNNDAAASAFSTLALWLLVRGLRYGYTSRCLMILGGAVGLAALSKVSALALAPLTILVVGFRTWFLADRLDEVKIGAPAARRDQRFMWFLVRCCLFLAPVLAVSGWWYVRNAILYGDPFGLGTHLETWWAHEEPLSPAQIWAQLPNVELSLWAAFGWGNVHLPPVFYFMVRAAVRLAWLGLLVSAAGVWRDRRPLSSRGWSVVLLALWVVIVFVALLRWMQLVEAALGRLLFPAIGAIAALITLGLTELAAYASNLVSLASDAAQRVSYTILSLFTGGLLCAAAVSPFTAIKPAYAKPPLLSDAEVAGRTDPISVHFGDGIRLVGYRVQARSVTPGGKTGVTLCWEATAPMSRNYAYFVHFLGPNESIVGARDTHPGLGKFPTSQWARGDTFCDVVQVPVTEAASAPGVYDVEIGWYDPGTGDRLPAQGAGGVPMELVTLEKIKVASGEQGTLQAANRVDADLGGQVTLLGYEMEASNSQIARGQTIDVTLYWEAQSRLTEDYTVFVHLVAPSGLPHAQHDGRPCNDTYPTSFWDVGEVVLDTHALRVPNDLAPGDYSLVAGMYVLETGARLPAFNGQGDRLPDDAVPLTTIKVQP